MEVGNDGENGMVIGKKRKFVFKVLEGIVFFMEKNSGRFIVLL